LISFLGKLPKQLWPSRTKAKTALLDHNQYREPRTSIDLLGSLQLSDGLSTHGLELSDQKAMNTVPRAIQEYLAEISDPPTKVTINGAEPAARVAEFQALNTVVFAEGWSILEPWGIWTEGNTATLFMKNPFYKSTTAGADHSIEILLDARAPVTERNPTLTISCGLGGPRIETVFVRGKTSRMPVRILVPASLSRTSIFRLTIAVDDPRSPYNETDGASPDRRLLGVGISSIEILKSCQLG
jgi:hypothetical protein